MMRHAPRSRRRLAGAAAAAGLAGLIVAVSWAAVASATAVQPATSTPPATSAPPVISAPQATATPQATTAPSSAPGSIMGRLPFLPKSLPSIKALEGAASYVRSRLPAAVLRWLYNPRERTASAIADAKAGDRESAMGNADTALRLAPDEPLASYNAGTARLAGAGGPAAGGADETGGAGAKGANGGGAGGPAPGAGAAEPRGLAKLIAELAARRQARAAEPLLERAAKAAGPDLAPAASYNLGNARYAAGDFAGAVEAYKATLRAVPGDRDAKFNLELAWREQQRRQQQRSPRGIGPRGGGGNPRQGEASETAGQGGTGTVGDNPRPGQTPEQRAASLRQGQSQGQNGQAQTTAGLQGQPSPLSGRQALTGYQDQPEMSASEAAAVLESVQNLERQQRRLVAARLARQRAANGKDW